MTDTNEMRLLALSDTSRVATGRICKAVFEIHADDKEALLGLEGRRFAVALKLINDDEAEQPVKKKQDRRVQQCAILCNEILFEHFLEERHKKLWEATKETPEAVRQYCGIKSRKELATNAYAAAHWDKLSAGYELWKRGA